MVETVVEREWMEAREDGKVGEGNSWSVVGGGDGEESGEGGRSFIGRQREEGRAIVDGGVRRKMEKVGEEI